MVQINIDAKNRMKAKISHFQLESWFSGGAILKFLQSEFLPNSLLGLNERYNKYIVFR
jgi:hypothetical protein